ncbi:MAG: hypothetical protein H6622_08930 [Halobacteriovoraceae bacterium]|nr:hypothetical protein [Halobacteriovoraceae bacterium]
MMKFFCILFGVFSLSLCANNITRDSLALEIFQYPYLELPGHAQLFMDSFDENNDTLYNIDEVLKFKKVFHDISKKIKNEGSSALELIDLYSQNNEIDPIEIKWALSNFVPQFLNQKLKNILNPNLLAKTLELLESGQFSVHNVFSLNSFDLLAKDFSFYGKLEKLHQVLFNFNELMQYKPTQESFVKVFEFFTQYKIFPYFKGENRNLTLYLHQISKMSLGPKGLYRYYLMQDISVIVKNGQFVFQQPKNQESFILKHPQSYRVNSIPFLKKTKKRIQMAFESGNSKNILRYLIQSDDIFSQPQLLAPMLEDLTREVIFFLDIDTQIMFLFDEFKDLYLNGMRSNIDFEKNIFKISSRALEDHFKFFGHKDTLQLTLYLLIKNLIYFTQKYSTTYEENFEVFNSLNLTNLVFGTYGNFYYTDQPIEHDANNLAKELSEVLILNLKE